MFSIKMQDMMSSGLIKLASNSNTAFNKMANHTKQLADKNKVLGMSYNELQSKIKQTEDTISRSTIPSQIAAARRELAALQRQSNNHSGNINNSNSSIGVGTIAGGAVLGNVITQGISMIGSGIGSMIRGSMEKETAIAGMSTFLGKSGAKDAYSNIQKDAEATPFDTASLLEVNRSLISAGLNAKSARNDSMNLANAIVAVGGSNDTLTRMAANMQQIKTVGKATAMDIRQFGIAGINIYEMLARSTGKSIDQVKEMDVSYQELAKSMAMAAGKGGIYENALNNAMNTQQGKWSNLQESVTNRLTKIGEAFSPVTIGIMDMGVKLSAVLVHVESFAKWITSGSTSAGIFISLIGGLTTAYLTYQGVIGAVALKTWLLTASTWQLNAALIANPIGITVIAIAALVAGIAIAYNKFEKFRAIVDGVWGVLKQLGSNILDMFYKLPNMIIEAFTQIPKAILEVFSGVGNLFSAIFSGNFKAIPGILASIGGNILKTNPITGFASNVFEQVSKGTGKAFNNAHNESINLSAIDRHKRIKELATQREKDRAADKVKTTVLATGGAMMATNNASGKTAGDTVSGAGPKVVNIHVGKFFDSIQFTTMNGKESAQELENVVMECLARILYNGAKTV